MQGKSAVIDRRYSETRGRRMRNVLQHLVAALVLAVVALPAGRTLTPVPQPVTLTVTVDQTGAKIDPIFYGLMTEEINFSYDGGLYAELIRNRTFRENPQNPVHWSVVKY